MALKPRNREAHYANNPTHDDHEISADDLPLDIIFKRVEVGYGNCGVYMAICPAHHDKSPSLSICELEDKRVLLHCHAGCKTELILDKINLKMKHLFPSEYALTMRGEKVRAYTPRPKFFEDFQFPEIDYAKFHKLINTTRIAGNEQLEPLAKQLNVSIKSLDMIEAGVLNGEFSIPEYDADRRPVGITLRKLSGEKRCLKGSHRGLILPTKRFVNRKNLYVTEGASDALAMLSAKYNAIGRPAATPSKLVLSWLIKYLRNETCQIVIVGDNDSTANKVGVGETAAQQLAQILTTAFAKPVYWALPEPGFKDVREQFSATGNARKLNILEAY